MDPHTHTNTHTHTRARIHRSKPAWIQEMWESRLIFFMCFLHQSSVLQGSSWFLICDRWSNNFLAPTGLELPLNEADVQPRPWTFQGKWKHGLKKSRNTKILSGVSCARKSMSGVFIEFHSAAPVSGLLVFFMLSCCRGLLGHLSRTEPPLTLLEHLCFSCSKVSKMSEQPGKLQYLCLYLVSYPFTSIQQKASKVLKAHM